MIQVAEFADQGNTGSVFADDIWAMLPAHLWAAATLDWACGIFQASVTAFYVLLSVPCALACPSLFAAHDGRFREDPSEAVGMQN